MTTATNLSRGERILSKLVESDRISMSGKDWLVAAVDPFHDKQFEHLTGYPDLQTGPSAVSCVKGTMTIKKPTAAPAGPWRCFIIQWPWLAPSSAAAAAGNYASSPRNGANITMNVTAPGFNSRVGGLMAYYVPVGLPLDITEGNGTLRIGVISVDPLYTSGLARLIGIGFEVHNVTNQLEDGGSCIAFREMSNENTNIHWELSSTSEESRNNFAGPFVRYPPVDESSAMLLPGSRQWEARDGCYCVGAFHSVDNPATMVMPTAPVIASAGYADDLGQIATSNVYAPLPGPLLAGAFSGKLRSNVSFRVHNFHLFGAYFSGLSDNSSLTINQNVFMEKFPGPDDKVLLPLATPSAQFDPDVLDLYSRVIVDLPVAVPVSENGLGDWFYEAASTALKYLTPAISAIPHPLAQAIGGVMGSAQKAMEPPKKKNNQGPKKSETPPNAWGPPPIARQPRRQQPPPSSNKVKLQKTKKQRPKQN